MFQLILGTGLALFILGGLSDRPAGVPELVPGWTEALALGIFFLLASLPSPLAILPRAVLILPSFLVFLDILENRVPPMPFGIAFFCAGFAVLFVTAYSAYLALTSQKPATKKP